MENPISISADTLAKINRFAVNPLSEEQVYCFSVILCDNDIDRDWEKFSDEALETLASLFIGKTGIFDHDPKGEKQSARIFDTQVKSYPDRQTADGREYKALIGYAYMVRTDDNRSLIAEIDGGIKKEVSVGCAVAKKQCSVCGSDLTAGGCAHIKGKRYGDTLCYTLLSSPTDAYEWSFVAVPAQRNAGVTKRHTEGTDDHRMSKALEHACEELRRDIMRLSYFTSPFRSSEAVSREIAKMEIYELCKLKRSLEKQAAETDDASDNSFITAKNDDGSFKV